jgi:hypothetical protein
MDAVGFQQSPRESAKKLSLDWSALGRLVRLRAVAIATRHQVVVSSLGTFMPESQTDEVTGSPVTALRSR